MCQPIASHCGSWSIWILVVDPGGSQLGFPLVDPNFGSWSIQVMDPSNGSGLDPGFRSWWIPIVDPGGSPLGFPIVDPNFGSWSIQVMDPGWILVSDLSGFPLWILVDPLCGSWWILIVQSCKKAVSWYLAYQTFLEENPDIFR